jgi:Spy/CpxP family protein refolding chaperone
MLWHRMAFSALAILAAAAVFAADPPKTEPPGKGGRLDVMAAKLGLSDQQKDDIRKIHADIEQKEAGVEHQLWTMRHEEREAVGKVLTDEQRAKVPGLMKAARKKEVQKVEGELGATDDQKKKLEPVLEEYEQKFHELAAKSEAGREAFHKERHEFHQAIAKELTDEQRAKLPGVLREEYHQWRDPAARREHLKALADQLGLDDKQREEIKKIHAEFDQKDEPLTAQLKQLHQEEHAAVGKVLTDEQRQKVQEWRKEREAAAKKAG